MMTLAIFTEGTESTDPARNSFLELWHWLALRAGATSPRIVGFSKGSLVRIYRQGISNSELVLGPGPADTILLDLPPEPPREPLDILIARAHASEPFDRMVLAFDREPRHNALRNKCRRAELFLALMSLENSVRLPERFRAAASTLHYDYFRRLSRASRLCLEILVMERLFEDLLLCDEKGLRAALEVPEENSTSWPNFRHATAKPDEHIFKPACKLASRDVHDRMRDRDCRDKHRWAKYILERLPDTSPVWTHPIFTRLQKLLSD